MKRVLNLVLAVVMLLAMSTTAFATTYQDFDTIPEETKPVTANYATASTPDPGTTYYFTITWTLNDTNTLTFTRGTKGYKWNGETMYYVEDNTKDVADKWEGETGYKVTVTNQSNASVYVKTSATANYNLKLTTDKAANAGLDNAELTTAAVHGGSAITVGDTSKQGTAQEAAVTYTYAAQEGATAPAAEIVSSFPVGTITVKVSNTAIS